MAVSTPFCNPDSCTCKNRANNRRISAVLRLLLFFRLLKDRIYPEIYRRKFFQDQASAFSRYPYTETIASARVHMQQFLTQKMKYRYSGPLIFKGSGIHFCFKISLKKTFRKMDLLFPHPELPVYDSSLL